MRLVGGNEGNITRQGERRALIARALSLLRFSFLSSLGDVFVSRGEDFGLPATSDWSIAPIKGAQGERILIGW